jgi:Na+-transporting NADH:ubiquinone oxidoreductase subunit C
MDNESPLKAILVVTATALVCSVLVTVTAVTLQPIQRAYQDLERIRFIVAISGVADAVDELSDLEVIGAFQDLDARIVDLDQGIFDTSFDADTFDTRNLTTDPQLSVAIPAEQDVARLGRRSSLVTVYLVRDDADLQRMILPVYGQGMWSTIYLLIAIEIDINTIAEFSFYDQVETPGIGDRILQPDWQARWRGRKLYDQQNTLRFSIARGVVSPDGLEAVYTVDGLTGATVTTDGVQNLIRYWFGPHGYAMFLSGFSTAGDS